MITKQICQLKTAGILLVAILFVGALVTSFNFSEAQVSQVPAAPTNLSATSVSDSQINLSWTAPVNSTQSQINGYRIEVRPLCMGSFFILANTNTTTYSDTNLISGICYEYRVSAINSIGIGNPSNTASATTWSEPSEPRSLSASAISSSQINLRWVMPSDTGGTQVNGYKIERRNSCAGSLLTIVANTSNTNTVYSDIGLTNGTCYQYRVFAHNIVGTSLPSNNATATTLHISPIIRLPSAPTGLNVSAISGTMLKLAWNVPSDQGSSPIIGYNIQRNGTVIVNNTGTTQTNYADTGLLLDHQQTYRIAAWNAAGLGPYSNAAIGKTGTYSTPKDFENLGQVISDFAHKYNDLFKQQRDESVKAIKECNEKVKNASPENRKEVRADCKIALDNIKEKFKELRNQFKADFKEFRDATKVVLKEAKESKAVDKSDIKEIKMEINQIKNDVKKEEKKFKKELKKEMKELKKELKKEKSKKDKNDDDDEHERDRDDDDEDDDD